MQPGLERQPLGLGLGGDAVEPAGGARTRPRVRSARGARSASSRWRSSPPPRPASRWPRPAGPPRRRRARPARRAAPSRLARETLDGQVELAAEPARGLLAGRADRRVELLRGRLRVAVASRETVRRSCSSCRCSTSPSWAATRCIASACSRSICSRELALAQTQPVGELLKRLPPLDPVLLEIGRGRGRELLRARASSWRSLAAASADPRARPGGARRRRRSAPRSASSAAPGAARAARSRRQGSPGAGRGRRSTPRRRSSTFLCAAVSASASFAVRLALALGHVGAALVHDPPLLLGERRQRLRAVERERPLEVGGALLDLARDDLVERRLAAADLVFERCASSRGRAAARRTRATAATLATSAATSATATAAVTSLG